MLFQGYTVATAKEKIREYDPFYWLSSERAVRKLIATRREKPWEKEADDHKSLEKRFDEEGTETGIRLLSTTPNEFVIGEATSERLVREVDHLENVASSSGR